jgi:hypothetical protein
MPERAIAQLGYTSESEVEAEPAALQLSPLPLLGQSSGQQVSQEMHVTGCAVH